MSEKAKTPDEMRARILDQPDLILDDRDVMRALASANELGLGPNVVDIRGIAMQRLEARLGRLEDTHRSVIAAAYENLAGTTQVQRAVLKLLEPTDFEDFLHGLNRDVAGILRVERIRLVLESQQDEDAEVLARLGGALSVAEPGFVDDYMTHNRDFPLRTVVLRAVHPEESGLYGRRRDRVASEACIRLELGPGRLPAMLAMGAADRSQFTPNQGTDLLEFFGGVFERALRRWLA